MADPKEVFDSLLIRSEQSKAYGRFCELVYGKNLTQFGTADLQQLDKLLALLRLNERSHVLDVGCGIGAQDEYISDVSGASITGIDFAVSAIRRAQERTRNKAARLSFRVGDVNDIGFAPATFDAAIAIDTLYFASDLIGSVGQMKAALKEQGQMGLFYTQVLTPSDSLEQLAGNETNLARVLKATDLAFEAHDLTENNYQFWQRTRDVAVELRAEFEAEGNVDICDGRIAESDAVLGLAGAGRISRYLYHVQLK